HALDDAESVSRAVSPGSLAVHAGPGGVERRQRLGSGHERVPPVHGAGQQFLRHRDRHEHGGPVGRLHVRGFPLDHARSASVWVRTEREQPGRLVAQRRFAQALYTLALLAAGAGVCVGQGAGPRPCEPQAPLGPSHDLYCIDLIAAPGARAASGRVELSPPAGPFTVGVTSDGHSRYDLIVSVAGLEPGRTYVAWLMTPQLDTIIKLGVVTRGSFVARDVALPKFVVLITAERSGRVQSPSEHLVLRGQSPSTRLFPPDQLTFAAGGSTATPAHEHEGHGDWPMVPMPANLTMLPAEMALRPGVAPYPRPSSD